MNENKKREIIGVVVSDKANKTITVKTSNLAKPLLFIIYTQQLSINIFIN